jgi:hypothetical protein
MKRTTLTIGILVGALGCDPGDDLGGAGRAAPAPGGDATTAAQALAPEVSAPQNIEPRSFLPLAVGNRWTYKVLEPGSSYEKTTEVVGREAVGGAGSARDEIAFKVATRRSTNGKTDLTISWQAWEGTRLVRYREVEYAAALGTREPTAVSSETAYEPHRLRLDLLPGGSPLEAAAPWIETFEERTSIPGRSPEVQPCAADGSCAKTERWAVVDVDRPITLTLDGSRTELRALVVARTGSGGSERLYWFVPGIGKVKEGGPPGASTIEELTSYTLAR